MAFIDRITAREILDSRGNPTLEVDVHVTGGAMGRAAVPSGASTGRHEAVEKRDGDPTRYNGKGVKSAVSMVRDVIFPHVRGYDVRDQISLDDALIALDSTPNKSRLGANAILGVSLAAAKAAASAAKRPLYQYIGGNDACILPMPLMNILNGGAHGDNAIDIQEFMIVPHGAPSFDDAVRMGVEVFHALKTELHNNGYTTNVGDEGGFAPALDTSEQALSLIMKSIERAGYKPGHDIALALDVAASEFYSGGKYHLKGEGKIVEHEELTAYYQNLCARFPIVSIEDGMAEDDFIGWHHLNKTLGNSILGRKIQIVGDDVFVTNTARLQYGIDHDLANAILIKPNQIGTLTETRHAIDMAHGAGYKSILSHRSGETEDTTIADLAVAFQTGQIKTGSLSRTDRLAKYNQLLRIAEELGPKAQFSSPF